MVTEGLPESTALRLDDGIRRSNGGRTLLGGAPMRLLRFSDAGARIVDDLATGAVVGDDATRQAVARRLIDAGMAHPRPGPAPPTTVTVVVPARDHTPELGSLLAALVDRDGLDVVVVDDGSANRSDLVATVAGRAVVIHHDASRGPAAARNTGWRSAPGGVVVFVDADVEVPPGWLDPLLGHLADPAVAAVAPRVRGRTGDRVIDRYEAHRSPLDLGPRPANVVPRGRVAYVPTATLVVRRGDLDRLGGFDESLRVGEDVDLVWRLADAGRSVRYEPSVVVTHRNRAGWLAFARQRRQYGSSSALLEQRHPGAVPAIEVNAWSLAAWTLAVGGGRRGAAAGATVAVVSAGLLVPKLRGRVDDPVTESLRLAGLGNLWAGRWLASTVTRVWWPPALAAAVVSRRARRVVVAAMIVPNVLEWIERRPGLDPVRWTIVRTLDDASYGAGVWLGCRRAGGWGPLRPRLSGIPGVTDR